MTYARAALARAQRLRGSGPIASHHQPRRHPCAPTSLRGVWRVFVRGLSACGPFLLISPIDGVDDIRYEIERNRRAQEKRQGKQARSRLSKHSSELNHRPSANLVSFGNSERKQYGPELNPGVDKPKKGASPWSTDELPRMSWLPVPTYCALSRPPSNSEAK